MANASCSTCTLVSNVLTLTGSVSGSLVVGMTITGASVPPGVTITSFGTGSGGIGTYNCSASAANIVAAEPMVFSLSWNMPLQGNSSSPQVLDLGRAAGFGLVIISAFSGGTAGPGQEYMFGTHAAAIYNEVAVQGTQIFPVAPGKQGPTVTKWIGTLPQFPEPIAPRIFTQVPEERITGNRPLQVITAAPQQFDFTLQAVITQPYESLSNAWTTEYQFGTHQKALYDSQGGTQIWKSQTTPPAVGGQVPLRSLHVQPQELNYDLTIQGFVRTVPVAQGWLLTYISAGPQAFDFTLQSTIVQARPFLSAFTGPVSPKTIVSVNQADTTQIASTLFAPPSRVVAGAKQPFISASPDRFDYFQRQGEFRFPANPGPSKFVQPAIIFAFEQQYDKTDQPQLVFVPLIFNVPPIPPPVIVQAPIVSVWTTDSTVITADSLNYTADGADLINGGSSGASPQKKGGIAYTVSQWTRY
jgi:hypothetical protein